MRPDRPYYGEVEMANARRSSAPGPPLRLGLVTHTPDAFSLRQLGEYVTRELAELGVHTTKVPEARRPPPDCDVLWDPGLAGTRGPHRVLGLTPNIPVVATANGAGAFTLPWRHSWRSRLTALAGQVRKRRAQAAWRRVRSRLGAIVALSDFGAREVSRAFGLPPEKLYRIYPGISPAIFRPDGERPPSAERPYLLSVAQYSPKKNFEAVLAAYARLPRDERPDLVAVMPGWRRGPTGVDGVRLLSDALGHEELARWYRGALAFVFPSLHETFGYPIVEAMACGCPVITSNVSACPEVAGGAALLVDPASTEEIGQAMRRMQDGALRSALRERGLSRAAQFTWRATAERYLALFRGLTGRDTMDSDSVRPLRVAPEANVPR
jgi:glycosyltransferase involved in cell wall biosynthesis